MKTRMLILFGFLLAMGEVTRADTVWDSGHHEINAGDVYGEIWMYNDATATMLGGEAFKLEAADTSIFDMRGGEMDRMFALDNSTFNIHGGTIGSMSAYENSTVNLYAYDVIYHPTSDPFVGWIEGMYYLDDSYFSFDIGQDSFSHVNIVPEPTTLLLLGMGGLCLRLRKKS